MCSDLIFAKTDYIMTHLGLDLKYFTLLYYEVYFPLEEYYKGHIGLQ